MTITGLTRWDPFRDAFTIQDRMHRLLGDTLAHVPSFEAGNAWYPPVDIFEESDQIVLRAELPGVNKDEIDIRVENGTFLLRGEKKQETQSENPYRIERFYGSFARSFALPTTINAEKIRATYKDGVLEVVLPKAEEAKPRKIKVLGD